jgi:hypothetical protein
MKAFWGTIILFCCLSGSVFTQLNEGPTTHFTIGVLDQMGKIELTGIYLSQCSKLSMLLPYIPFNQNGDAVSLSTMGIPDTNDNNGFVKKLDSSSGSYHETLESTLSVILPYAEKLDIINSILFLQDIIERIETGL